MNAGDIANVVFRNAVLGVVALALSVCLCGAAAGEALHLTIGDGRDWAFINGPWKDAGGGRIDCPETGATHFLAFLKERAFSDLTAEFKFMTSYRETGAGDAGLVLRARDANHYYWVHFPWCGQQLRAKHFWAAISKVDESGYIRNLALVMMPSIPSETDRWYDVRVQARGREIRVWVDGRPGPVVTDAAYRAGRIGLAGYGGFSFKDVRVSGREVAAKPWDEKLQPPRNWINPCPHLSGSQNMASVCRAPGGDILLAIPSDKATYIARSRDNGRSWSDPQELPAALHYGSLHTTAKRRLLMQVSHADPREVLMAESQDDGRTWSEPAAAVLTGEWPTDPPKLHAYGPLLELSDGTLVRFIYGGMKSNAGKNVVQWGSFQCQAFAIRSSDGGKTWSAPANLDRPSWVEQPAGTIPGCLDLTEPVGAVLGNGGILCYVRPIHSPTMWETWSSDGGLTWTSARRGPFPGYAPCMGRTSSGVLLVAHRFPDHSINVSYDNGLTWDTGTTVDFPVWAMGCMMEVEPEVMLFVYMDANRQFLRSQLIRVTRDGLQPIRPVAQTVRDRMWIWGTREAPGSTKRSLSAYIQAGPAQRAKMLGLRNVFIAGGIPLEPGRAKELAEPVARMNGRLFYEVCWSQMTGHASDYEKDIIAAKALAAEFPSLEGVLLDDLTSQQIAGRGMSVEELQKVCDSFHVGPKRIPVWGVVYTMNLDHPGLAEYLKPLDGINLWTWDAKDLPALEENLARCEQLAPGKPIILGIYLYDYGAGRPMPLDLLQRQCDQALTWLKQNRIADIVFLTITPEPKALSFARSWISGVADEQMP